MPDRRARFAFEMDKKVSVSNKRSMARLASRQVYDSLTYAQRTLAKLEETIAWLARLNDAEDRLLSLRLLKDTDEAMAEQEMRMQVLQALISARKAVLAIRERKSEVATQMEEDFDPFFKDENQPKRVVRKPVAKPATVTKVENVAKWQPAAPPLTPKIVMAAGAAPPATQPRPAKQPSAMELKLDAALIARARREISSLAKEDAEN